jgi:hypothetical protein
VTFFPFPGWGMSLPEIFESRAMVWQMAFHHVVLLYREVSHKVWLWFSQWLLFWFENSEHEPLLVSGLTPAEAHRVSRPWHSLGPVRIWLPSRGGGCRPDAPCMSYKVTKCYKMIIMIQHVTL